MKNVHLSHWFIIGSSFLPWTSDFCLGLQKLFLRICLLILESGEGRERERKREREKHWCEWEPSICFLSYAPCPGIEPQPRRVPWLRIKLDGSPSNWATPVRDPIAFYLFLYLFLNILFIFFFREKGREGERERNIGQQPRHVSWLGIELETFGFAGQHSIHWATPARVPIAF